MAEFSFQAFILRAQAHVDICDSAYQRLESGIQQALPVMQKAKQAEAAMREVVRWPGPPAPSRRPPLMIMPPAQSSRRDRRGVRS